MRLLIRVTIVVAFLLGSVAAAGLGLGAPDLWSWISPEGDGWPDCSNCGPNGSGCSCLCSNGA